jgi:hypothetical protein
MGAGGLNAGDGDGRGDDSARDPKRTSPFFCLPFFLTTQQTNTGNGRKQRRAKLPEPNAARLRRETGQNECGLHNIEPTQLKGPSWRTEVSNKTPPPGKRGVTWTLPLALAPWYDPSYAEAAFIKVQLDQSPCGETRI